MKQISHPSIIAFKEALENEDSISIVMELFNNLSLAEYLKKHSKAMS
jgi:serine/threonine protein kinase